MSRRNKNKSNTALVVEQTNETVAEVTTSSENGETTKEESVEKSKERIIDNTDTIFDDARQATDEILTDILEEIRLITDNLGKVSKAQTILQITVYALAVLIGGMLTGLFFLNWGSLNSDRTTEVITTTEVATEYDASTTTEEEFDLTSVQDVNLYNSVFEYSGMTYTADELVGRFDSGDMQLITLVYKTDGDEHRYDCLLMASEKYTEPELYYQGGNFRLRIPVEEDTNE